jgi:hypothetical protein
MCNKTRLFFFCCHWFFTISNGNFLDSEYNFQLFEDFEGTKTVYQDEAKLVKTIQEVKESLLQKKKHIQNYLKTKNYGNKMQNLLNLQDGFNTATPLKSYFPAINTTTSEFPTELDLYGSIKGITNKLTIVFQLPTELCYYMTIYF